MLTHSFVLGVCGDWNSRCDPHQAGGWFHGYQEAEMSHIREASGVERCRGVLLGMGPGALLNVRDARNPASTPIVKRPSESRPGESRVTKDCPGLRLNTMVWQTFNSG